MKVAVKQAKQIVVMSQGEVIEQGSHLQLLALQGHYHAMLNVTAQPKELQ